MQYLPTFRACLGAVTLFLAMQNSVSAALEIIGHRGASYDAPENTLTAMKLAWEQNADAIELDLHLSKDGRIVVIHDADTKRVGGVDRKVKEQSWEEIQKLDVGTWKAPRFKGEPVPALDSILATIPAGRRAVLELKCGVEILPELDRMLRESGRKPHELAIISFDFDTLRESKKRLPRIEHYFLHGYKKDATTERFPELAPILTKAKEAQFEGLDLHFDWPIDREFVTAVKLAGMKLVVWTVNDPVVARRLAAAGVDGITTDRPGWLKETLRGNPVAP